MLVRSPITKLMAVIRRAPAFCAASNATERMLSVTGSSCNRCQMCRLTRRSLQLEQAPFLLCNVYATQGPAENLQVCYTAPSYQSIHISLVNNWAAGPNADCGAGICQHLRRMV